MKHTPDFLQGIPGLDKYAANKPKARLVSSSLGYSASVFNPPLINNLTITEQIAPKHIKELHKLWRTIHRFDPIAGVAIELYGAMPFGDFSISGCSDEALGIYNASLDNLNLNNYFTNFVIEYLVLGKLCLHFIFNNTKGIWEEIIDHNPDYIKILPVPVLNANPIIQLTPSPELKNFAQLALREPSMSKYRNMFGANVLYKLINGQDIQLHESNTVYLPRKLDSHDYLGTSMYSRILAIYTYESALMNGNQEAIRRRMGPLRLLTPETADSIMPSEEELQNIVNTIMQAERDPVGGVVALRRGLKLDSIPAGEWIRLNDEWALLQESKLKSLGISDTFLTGEATYSNMDTVLSVFLERIRNLRSFFEQKILYERIFLPLAKVHGFKKEKTARVNNKVYVKEDEDSVIWDLPSINWANKLQPSSDQTYMDFLEKAEEKGFVVPLELYAAACGLKPESILNGKQSDLELRASMAKYKEEVQALTGTADDSMGGDDFGGDMGMGDDGLANALKSDKVPVSLKSVYSNLEKHLLYNKGKFLGYEPVSIAKCYDRIIQLGKSVDIKAIEEVCKLEKISTSSLKMALRELGIASVPLSVDDIRDVAISAADKGISEKEMFKLLQRLQKTSKRVPGASDTNKDRLLKYVQSNRSKKARKIGSKTNSSQTILPQPNLLVGSA